MAKINLDIQSMDIDDLIEIYVEARTELFKVAPVFDFNDMLIMKGKRKYIKKVLKGWTPSEIQDLLEKAKTGMSAKNITATYPKRTISGVRHALNRLGYFAIKRGGAYVQKEAQSTQRKS